MSSDEEEASHVIVVEGIHRLGESPFLGDVHHGKPSTDEENLHNLVKASIHPVKVSTQT